MQQCLGWESLARNGLFSPCCMQVVCSKTNVCHIIDPADRCRVVDSFEILPPCDRRGLEQLRHARNRLRRLLHSHGPLHVNPEQTARC